MKQKEISNTISYCLFKSSERTNLIHKFEWLYNACAFLIGGLKDMQVMDVKRKMDGEKYNRMINDLEKIMQEIELIMTSDDLITSEMILKVTSGVSPDAVKKIRKLYVDFLRLKANVIAIIIASGFTVYVPIIPEVYPEREESENIA